MGLFKKNKNKCLNVSGDDLMYLFSKEMDVYAEKVSKGCFITPEIMFDTDEGGTHFIGVEYDKRKHKKEHTGKYNESYSTYYLDEKEFKSLEDMYVMGKIGDVFLRNMRSGIIIFSEDTYIKWLNEKKEDAAENK